MPAPNAILKQTLQNVLWLHQHRAELEAVAGQDAVGEIVSRYDDELARLWRAMAALRAGEKAGAAADDAHPGYVLVKTRRGVVHVPFHLVPALPERAVLDEAVKLADRIALRSGGAICLSGSALLLGDIARTGDVDFCEYVATDRKPRELAAAFQRLIAQSDRRHFVVSIKTRDDVSTPFQEFETLDISGHDGPLDAEQCRLVSEAMATALNGKASFLTATRFAGVTEVTNWLIFHGDSLESEPAAQLSFASQEASLGVWPGRPLHVMRAVGAYLQFLRGQIERHAATDPVKAVKRAIPWLRLFGEATLLDELLERMRDEGAFACAAALARIELQRRHATAAPQRVPPGWTRVMGELQDEIKALAAEGMGRAVPSARIERMLTLRLRGIGKRLAAKGGGGSLWDRILAVAEGA